MYHRSIETTRSHHKIHQYRTPEGFYTRWMPEESKNEDWLRQLTLHYYSLTFFPQNRRCYQNAKAGETVKFWLITVCLAVTSVLEPPNTFMCHTAANPVSITLYIIYTHQLQSNQPIWHQHPCHGQSDRLVSLSSNLISDLNIKRSF